MKHDLKAQCRKANRLSEYDYSQAGVCFVTICLQDGGRVIFGNIKDGQMVLNSAGQICSSVWNDLPNHYSNVELGESVVMPNHFHGIIKLNLKNSSIVGAGFKNTHIIHGLPEIVRAFKTFSARKINEQNGTIGARLWQRSYYEHIIRNEEDYLSIAEYIINNPMRWADDELWIK
jgi:REP element-mobilizing transposase RayT